MTKLALLISKAEGFGVPGAVPTTHHNPGDLRHSPHSQHGDDPNAIGKIDTDADGWADLERQLELFAERGYTLEKLIYTWAPPSDNNPTAAYLATVCREIGLPPETLVSKALEIKV